MSRPVAQELLDRAAVARAEGDADGARAVLVAGFEQADEHGDLETMTAAALALAGEHRFGTHPGRLPAFLHAAYQRAEGSTRTHLASALARIWVYGGEVEKARPFAAAAVADASAGDDPALLAEALDAQLLVSWGPDELADRVRITAQLEEVVAHVIDAESRMSAHLWRLTTALETHDALAVQRQVRALEQLAAETGSPRVRLFAASRRGMQALLTADVAMATEMLDAARRAGIEAGEPDTEAIEHTLTAGIARVTSDRTTLAAEAASHESFGTAEGIPSIAAEGASLWLAAGEPGRARAVLDQLLATDLAAVPRDVDWLMTVSTLVEVAAGTGAEDVTERGIDLLAPYAGQGVVNAGGVAYLGVVDEFVYRACRAGGRTDEAARWRQSAAAAYQRLGAAAYLQRLGTAPAAATMSRTVVLRPEPGGVWTVGAHDATSAVRDMRGLHHLRALLGRPGADVPATELVDQAAGHAGESIVQHDLGELLDARAAAEYRRRLADLDADLIEAQEGNDTVRCARLRAERDAIVDQLRSAAGWAGGRRTVGATSERARVTVRKAIAAATERIADQDPALGRLLRDTIRTGTFCRYEPDPARPIRWVL